jgi:hypothetical protein
MEVLYFPFLSGQDGTDWRSLTKHDHSRAATHVRDYRHGGTFRIEMTGLALAATAALSCPTDAKRGWWPCERTQGLSPRPPKKTHKQGRTARRRRVRPFAGHAYGGRFTATNAVALLGIKSQHRDHLGTGWLYKVRPRPRLCSSRLVSSRLS